MQLEPPPPNPTHQSATARKGSACTGQRARGKRGTRTSAVHVRYTRAPCWRRPRSAGQLPGRRSAWRAAAARVPALRLPSPAVHAAWHGMAWQWHGMAQRVIVVVIPRGNTEAGSEVNGTRGGGEGGVGRMEYATHCAHFEPHKGRSNACETGPASPGRGQL